MRSPFSLSPLSLRFLPSRAGANDAFRVRRSALHFTPEEFQALLKEREQEERTRRRAEKEDHWGTGWTKRAAGGTPTARKSRWVQALRRCVAALMGWLRRLAPEKPTVNTK